MSAIAKLIGTNFFRSYKTETNEVTEQFQVLGMPISNAYSNGAVFREFRSVIREEHRLDQDLLLQTMRSFEKRAF